MMLKCAMCLTWINNTPEFLSIVIRGNILNMDLITFLMKTKTLDILHLLKGGQIRDEAINKALK